MTRDEASLFFRLIAYRHGRAAILLTTGKVRGRLDRTAGQ